MFINDSTENLLDNLENELTEVIELDNPPADSEKKVEMPPIPAKRNFIETPNEHLEVIVVPVPVARRIQSLDKNEKNDENEIIQLSSVSSSSGAEIQKYISHSPKMVLEEKHEKEKLKNNNIVVVQELAQNEENFIVTKHGKWAKKEKEMELVELTPKSVIRVPKPKPHIEIVTEKPTEKHSKSNSSSASQTSFDESSESSSSEESLKPVKKSRKSKSKDKKKTKKKVSDASSTESSAQKVDGKSADSSQTIGKTSKHSL